MPITIIGGTAFDPFVVAQLFASVQPATPQLVIVDEQILCRMQTSVRACVRVSVAPAFDGARGAFSLWVASALFV